MGFICANIPSFVLDVGDTLAFDLGEVASADVEVVIELASSENRPFTKVVTNNQTPLNPGATR